MKNQTKVWALAIATLSAAPVWAQSAPDPMTMDHSQHGVMPPDNVQKNKVENKDVQKKNAPNERATRASASQPSAASVPGADHSATDHGGKAKPAASAMSAMDHDADASVPATPGKEMPGMDHNSPPAGQPPSGGADHGDMKMQGGRAPADARDPHAYSGGTTLTTGPYALPPSQRLRMADEHNFASLLVDRLERSYGRDSNSTSYDAQAWFGRDYNRLVIKAEGDAAKGKLQEARSEVLWGHAIAPFWDTQLGVRFDHGVGPDRSWLALGVQGLAPYWFEVDATAYVGEQGRTAVRLGAEYELLLTQKLILQPRVELNVYGKSDTARGLGSGLAESQAGVRLRYEFSRQFAPYIGVERVSKYGQTAKLARQEGETDGETRWVAGLRFWF